MIIINTKKNPPQQQTREKLERSFVKRGALVTGMPPFLFVPVQHDNFFFVLFATRVAFHPASTQSTVVTLKINKVDHPSALPHPLLIQQDHHDYHYYTPRRRRDGGDVSPSAVMVFWWSFHAPT